MADARLTERTAAALGQKILSGAWKTGEKLPDDNTLCSEYGISRTVLREALRILAAKGLISAKPRQGTHITPITEWAVWDKDVLHWLAASGLPTRAHARHMICAHARHMRLIIEPGLAALAASHATDTQKQQLQAALRDLQTDTSYAHEIALLEQLYLATDNIFAFPLRYLVYETVRQRATPPPLADYAALTVAISQSDAATARRIATQSLMQLFS